MFLSVCMITFESRLKLHTDQSSKQSVLSAVSSTLYIYSLHTSPLPTQFSGDFLSIGVPWRSTVVYGVSRGTYGWVHGSGYAVWFSQKPCKRAIRREYIITVSKTSHWMLLVYSLRPVFQTCLKALIKVPFSILILILKKVETYTNIWISSPQVYNLYNAELLLPLVQPNKTSLELQMLNSFFPQ